MARTSPWTSPRRSESGRLSWNGSSAMSEQSKNAVMSADHLTLLGITPNDAAALATPPAKAATNGNGGTAKKPSTAKSATPARQPATAAATAAAGKSAYDDI